MEMTDSEKLAIGVCMGSTNVDKLKKAFPNAFEAGVDFTVRIKGLVKKGAGHEQATPAALPQKDMLVDALDIMAEMASAMNDATRATFLERLAERANRPVDEDRKRAIEGDVAEAFMKRFVNGQRQEMDSERAARFDQTWQAVAGTTIRVYQGSVKFKGEVDLVETDRAD